MTISHNKKYYKIGEIAKYLNITPPVLRFWETKFPQLKPKKNKNSNHRRYTQKDFDLIIKIHDLLYNKNFRIEGAIKKLSSFKDNDFEDSTETNDLILDKETIKEELILLKKLVEEL